MKHQKSLFIIVLLFSLIFRLSLTTATFHPDILSQADWGKYIYDHGPDNFYNHDVWTFSWPNHPPLISLWYGHAYRIYRDLSLNLHRSSLFLINHTPNPAFLASYHHFVETFDPLVSPETPYSLGFLISLKLLPILSDLLIAVIIYKLASFHSKWPLLFSTIYLLSPFSWSISSLWGQTDSVGFLFTLLSFIALPSLTIPSIVLFYLGIAIKPTAIFLAPLFLFLLFKLKPKLITVFFGLLICLLITQISFKVFSPDKNIFDFTTQILMPRLADRPSRLTTNSYNFWHLFTLDRGLSGSTRILGVQGIYLAVFFYLLINLYAFSILKKLDRKSIISALFIVAFGFWLFFTDMLERYAFAGIVTGLILTIYYPKAFIYWLILSLTFYLNLFRGWWYPSSFKVLKNIMVYNNYIFGYLPSAINTIIFFIIAKFLSLKSNIKKTL